MIQRFFVVLKLERGDGHLFTYATNTQAALDFDRMTGADSRITLVDATAEVV
jgi:hypothetical protein